MLQAVALFAHRLQDRIKMATVNETGLFARIGENHFRRLREGDFEKYYAAGDLIYICLTPPPLAHSADIVGTVVAWAAATGVRKEYEQFQQRSYWFADRDIATIADRDTHTHNVFVPINKIIENPKQSLAVLKAMPRREAMTKGARVIAALLFGGDAARRLKQGEISLTNEIVGKIEAVAAMWQAYRLGADVMENTLAKEVSRIENMQADDSEEHWQAFIESLRTQASGRQRP